MSRPPKKIILLGGFAESLVVFRKTLLKTMVEAGHSVMACAPNASPAIVDELAALGVAYHHVPISRTGLNPFEDLRTLWALMSLFKEYQPDQVLSYTIKPVIYGSLAAKLANVTASFAMITGAGKAFADEPGIKRRAMQLVARLLYRNSLKYNRAVFFQNPDDRNLFRQLHLFHDKQQIVTLNGSGVELDHYAVSPPPSDGVSFLLIARLIKEKGIHDYVDAARVIKQVYPETIFRLVGWIDNEANGVKKDELDAWIAEGVIDYLGKLDDVRPAIASSSIYVLPSYYPEGTPRSILEAMAMGRPIITTDSPGCRETVKPGVNGYLIPPQNPSALVKKMEMFIKNPELIVSMAQESRRLAADRYDVNKVNYVILDAMGLA